MYFCEFIRSVLLGDCACVNTYCRHISMCFPQLYQTFADSPHMLLPGIPESQSGVPHSPSMLSFSISYPLGHLLVPAPLVVRDHVAYGLYPEHAGAAHRTAGRMPRASQHTERCPWSTGRRRWPHLLYARGQTCYEVRWGNLSSASALCSCHQQEPKLQRGGWGESLAGWLGGTEWC